MRSHFQGKNSPLVHHGGKKEKRTVEKSVLGRIGHSVVRRILWGEKKIFSDPEKELGKKQFC